MQGRKPIVVNSHEEDILPPWSKVSFASFLVTLSLARRRMLLVRSLESQENCCRGLDRKHPILDLLEDHVPFGQP